MLYTKLKAGGVIGSVVGEPPGARERGLTVRTFLARADAGTIARYARAVADGKLVIPITARMPLAAAREAQTLAETKHPGGKVLLLG